MGMGASLCDERMLGSNTSIRKIVRLRGTGTVPQMKHVLYIQQRMNTILVSLKTGHDHALEIFRATIIEISTIDVI